MFHAARVSASRRLPRVQLLNQSVPPQLAFPAPVDPVARIEAVAEAPALPPAQSVDPEDVRGGSEGNDDDSLPALAVILIIVPIVLVVLMCLACFALHRRRQHKKAAADTGLGDKAAAGQAPVGGMGPGTVPSVPWDKGAVRVRPLRPAAPPVLTLLHHRRPSLRMAPLFRSPCPQLEPGG